MNKKLIESEAKDYLGITLALVLYSFGFTFFLMPYEIVTGGIRCQISDEDHLRHSGAYILALADEKHCTR